MRNPGCAMIVVEPSLLVVQLGLDTSIGLHAMPIDAQVDLSTLASRLPTEIREAVAKRQREFLVGRYCAARALAHAGYLGDGWLPLGEDRLPVWPAGWIGSISHSRFGAVAVATPVRAATAAATTAMRTAVGPSCGRVRKMADPLFRGWPGHGEGNKGRRILQTGDAGRPTRPGDP